MMCKGSINFIVLDTKIIGELGSHVRIRSMAMTPEYSQSDKYSKIMDLSRGVEVRHASSDVLRVVTREASPEGILAEIDTPGVLDDSAIVFDNEKVLFLFRISDPGNLGTLMRTALAFEWNRIVLVDDCVDPFNPECIKSSMGAALKLKIHRIRSDVLDKFIERNNLNVMIADSDANADIRDYQNQLCQSIGLVLGSEANGFTGFPSELYEKLSKVSVKMSKHVESLNVAVCGGILMNELYMK